jgi:hypothetical protein
MKNTTTTERPTGCTGNCCQGRFCDCAPNVDTQDDDQPVYLLERLFDRWPVATAFTLLALVFGFITLCQHLDAAAKGAA